MAAAGPGPEGGGLLVFAGCAEQEVALAKSFWNSVTLQPPLESRLAPRRPSVGSTGGGAGSRRGSGPAAAIPSRHSHVDAQKSGLLSQVSTTSRTQEDLEMEREDDQRTQYLQKAKRREEILALLRRQREDRILKEAVSRPHKPKTKTEESKVKVPESDMEDQESVKALI